MWCNTICWYGSATKLDSILPLLLDYNRCCCCCLCGVLQVSQLNGQKILNMKDLVKAVDSCSSDYLHFDLDYNQKVGRAEWF
jgi:hypothetical protein